MDYTDHNFFKKTILHEERPIRLICCFYCADTHEVGRDHILPHSYTARRDKREFKQGDIVPCCNECNIIKGSKLFDSVESVAEYLSHKYGTMYDRVLRSATWSMEEIAELGPNLGQMINAANMLKPIMEERINHLEFVSSGGWVMDMPDITLNQTRSATYAQRLRLIRDIDRGIPLRMLCAMHNMDHRLVGRVMNRSVFKEEWQDYIIIKDSHT